MDGPPLGSPRMSGETESEQRALRERRVERTEASNVIVRTGSDRISEWRIMKGYLTVTDMRACNAYASACHAQLRLIGDPHGGYYDEGRVWHPHVKAPAQATYGLGVGATTVVGPGGSRSRWASGSAPGAVSPGQTGSTDPTKA